MAMEKRLYLTKVSPLSQPLKRLKRVNLVDIDHNRDRTHNLDSISKKRWALNSLHSNGQCPMQRTTIHCDNFRIKKGVMDPNFEGWLPSNDKMTLTDFGLSNQVGNHIKSMEKLKRLVKSQLSYGNRLESSVMIARIEEWLKN